MEGLGDKPFGKVFYKHLYVWDFMQLYESWCNCGVSKAAEAIWGFFLHCLTLLLIFHKHRVAACLLSPCNLIQAACIL